MPPSRESSRTACAGPQPTPVDAAFATSDTIDSAATPGPKSDASASSGKPATRLPATVADATPAADAQAVRRGHLATGWPLASLIVNVVLITVAA
eukprot:4777430-Pleurochrysis_carterae.AAC.1